MSWHANINLSYLKAQNKTVMQSEHSGPLRVLKSLYPEGEAICHNVLVHPPSGLVGGDVLDMVVDVAAGAHALITTPGAARFYKSDGEVATQSVVARVAGGARLEWLPMENIAYSGCMARNLARFELASGAQVLGWDMTVLGLPAAGLAFERGYFEQELQMPGVWLERGRIDAQDTRLLHSPLGLAGHSCMATLFFLSGSPISTADKAAWLDAARSLCSAHVLAHTCGATSPNAQTLVLRVLATHTEQAHDLCRRVWACWRSLAWGLPTQAPRIWSM